MTLLAGAWTIGLILSLLALGVYVSFRIFDFPDITADGSFTLGAAVSASLILLDVNPVAATAAGFGAGMFAGATTGVLHTRFKIHGLLSGILVMTALYSVNLHIMGKSNLPLLSATTLATFAERGGAALFGGRAELGLWEWRLPMKDLAVLFGAMLILVMIASLLHWFFKTHLGTAMRATGDNPHMIRALGVNVGAMTVFGLALSNGLIALSGALLAQYQGFADIQMGIGMVVLGLASVIIGEGLVGTRKVGLAIIGAIMGALLFRLLVALALRWGLHPNDLKLMTAVFVFLALVAPAWLQKLARWRAGEMMHAGS
jgi:putative ABC transport system permease protein